MGIPETVDYALPTTVPDATVDWKLEPGRTALLVHDMQIHFLKPFRGTTLLDTVFGNIRQLASVARLSGIPVFFTAQPVDQPPEKRGLLTDMWGPGLTGSAEGAAIAPELTPVDADTVVTKWRYDAFARTELLDRMRTEGRDQLLVTGVYGHIGCLSTASRAFMEDIQPFVVADGIADFDQRWHDLTLQYVAGRCGVALTTATATSMLSPVAPTTVEEVLQQVAAALEVDPDTLSPDTNLLNEGLDSLRAMMLADNWAMAGAPVDVAVLFEQPTAIAMMEAIRSAQSETAVPS
ncbi:MAG: isochorismatase family protein [Actinomycetota bacterium]